jgi:spore coat protein A
MNKRIAALLSLGILMAAAFNVQPLSTQASTLLDPVTHSKFVNPLPKPARIDATSNGKFDIEMRETVQWLGLYDANSNMLKTTVWGYGFPGKGVTYPGPTFVAHRDVPIDVKWKNTNPPHRIPSQGWDSYSYSPSRRSY